MNLTEISYLNMCRYASYIGSVDAVMHHVDSRANRSKRIGSVLVSMQVELAKKGWKLTTRRDVCISVALRYAHIQVIKDKQLCSKQTLFSFTEKAFYLGRLDAVLHSFDSKTNRVLRAKSYSEVLRLHPDVEGIFVDLYIKSAYDQFEVNFNELVSIEEKEYKDAIEARLQLEGTTALDRACMREANEVHTAELKYKLLYQETYLTGGDSLE